MKRRELIAGAATVAGLAVANRVMAEPAAALTRAVTAKPDFVEATVVEVCEEKSGSPVIILKARDPERYGTIWIGAVEAISIGMILEGTKTLRPMTHELMATLIATLQGQIESTHIEMLDGTIFQATLKVVCNGMATDVDSRPSDAIALALRVQAPIFVVSHLMKQTTLEKVKAELKPE